MDRDAGRPPLRAARSSKPPRPRTQVDLPPGTRYAAQVAHIVRTTPASDDHIGNQGAEGESARPLDATSQGDTRGPHNSEGARSDSWRPLMHIP